MHQHALATVTSISEIFSRWEVRFSQRIAGYIQPFCNRILTRRYLFADQTQVRVILQNILWYQGRSLSARGWAVERRSETELTVIARRKQLQMKSLMTRRIWIWVLRDYFIESSEAVEISLPWTFVYFSETLIWGAWTCDVEFTMLHTAKLV